MPRVLRNTRTKSNPNVKGNVSNTEFRTDRKRFQNTKSRIFISPATFCEKLPTVMHNQDEKVMTQADLTC